MSRIWGGGYRPRPIWPYDRTPYFVEENDMELVNPQNGIYESPGGLTGSSLGRLYGMAIYQ